MPAIRPPGCPHGRKTCMRARKRPPVCPRRRITCMRARKRPPVCPRRRITCMRAQKRPPVCPHRRITCTRARKRPPVCPRRRITRPRARKRPPVCPRDGTEIIVVLNKKKCLTKETIFGTGNGSVNGLLLKKVHSISSLRRIWTGCCMKAGTNLSSEQICWQFQQRVPTF